MAPCLTFIEKWVDDIANAGGSLYCFHLEATCMLRVFFHTNGKLLTQQPANPLPLIQKIHDRKMKAGVAISPDTPSSAVTDEVGNAADMILVMTVYPGTH